MGNVIGAFTSVATAIVGLAILAVLVSRNSNTVGVTNSIGNVFTSSLRTAVSPITSSGNYSIQP